MCRITGIRRCFGQQGGVHEVAAGGTGAVERRNKSDSIFGRAGRQFHVNNREGHLYGRGTLRLRRAGGGEGEGR